jgi:prevent-host-death family protein
VRKEIGSYDAKTKLPEILRRVEAGESFTITNRGKAVAELIPSADKKQQQTRSAVTSLLKMKRVHIDETALKALREAGRK